MRRQFVTRYSRAKRQLFVVKNSCGDSKSELGQVLTYILLAVRSEHNIPAARLGTLDLDI